MIFITTQIKVLSFHGKVYYLQREEGELWKVLNDSGQVYTKSSGFAWQAMPSCRDTDYMMDTTFSYDEAREMLLKLNIR